MGSYAEKRSRLPSGFGWIKFALLGVVISIVLQGASCEVEPTESQCRPYIEKALKEQHGDAEERNIDVSESEALLGDQEDDPPTDEITDSTEGSTQQENAKDDDDNDENDGEVKEDDEDAKTEEQDGEQDDDEKQEEQSDDDNKTEEQGDDDDDKEGVEVVSKEETEEKDDATDDADDQDEDNKNETEEEQDKPDDDEDGDKTEEKEIQGDDDDDDNESILERPIEVEVREVEIDDDDEPDQKTEEDDGDDDQTKEDDKEEEQETEEEADKVEKEDDKEEEKDDKDEEDDDKQEKDEGTEEDEKGEKVDEGDETDEKEKAEDEDEDDKSKAEGEEEDDKSKAEGEEEDDKSKADDDDDKEDKDKDEDEKAEAGASKEDEEVEEKIEKVTVGKSEAEEPAESDEAEGSKDDTDQESSPEEEELTFEVEIPENLRPRDHIGQILKLEDSDMETILEKAIDNTLKSLKNLYDNAIKPLEMLYKYRDLSNRHFGDPEIFSKPLILFMGPWSGGKSSTINYLLDNEFSHTSLRTGAEPSPAYFNILMHGEEQEILDGTQLAADWTFSGLQKFGQSLLDRLKGIKLPNKLLEKVNIVEIPGILEIRKQVQRLFPFNDACQWFIDRADIIFLVYDPSKLDVGPETEAILDQLKGREYQTRIILNKADQVKPEELMRVQGTLIWNISPLMSSSEPPIMYSTSLWSLPYEAGAPTRLLLAQERAFLRDLREAIDKRVENKIASARRFAVRVRNHAKMVDCYLTTYYNHKSFFGNKKKISDDIIEYPQKYHIYEGLSTLTNISRYDLPDPDVYRDFFKINPLYEFKKLSETCTYFRGCPINQLDVAIAYDLPELVGKYKKAVEAAKEQLQKDKS